MTNNAMPLPDMLRHYRETRRLRAAEVALHLDVSEQTVHGWERGKSAPHWSKLSRLVVMYRIPAYRLRDAAHIEAR